MMRRCTFWLSVSAVFFACLLLSPASNALTEDEVLQRGLSDPDLQLHIQSRLSQAQAEVQAAGRWTNPSLEYSRENLDLPQGTSEEETLWLRQRINIAGVPTLKKKAAKYLLSATEYQLDMERRDWILRLRTAFYQSLAAQQQLTAVTALHERLQIMANTMQRRADKGDASRFDVLRINKELAIISNNKASANSDYNSHLSTLFALTNIQAENIQGDLLPTDISLPTLDIREHPRIKALISEQRSLEARVKTARRARWPELTLGIGRKEVSEPGLDLEGTAFSVGIDIPVFDRGQGQDNVALNRFFELEADKSLLARELRARSSALATSLRHHIQSANRLAQLNSNVQTGVSYLAEISYQAGELNVMELLDAYQSDLASTEHLIAVSLQARMTYIQLQHIHGK